MNRKSSCFPRRWRDAPLSARQIDLSGYASAQHRRYLRHQSEQDKSCVSDSSDCS